MSEPIVSIRNVSKHFGSFAAVDDVSIDIAPGEFFALLGPSGCGKTTLLRMISGFETPSEGAIFLDGRDVTDVPPNNRPVNMVFQSYAVFPHMTVEKNVGYGLKVDGVAPAEIRQRVDEALALVQLSDFRHRKPDQLSGGQRQRVALARALVKKPRVLLLDEPLSALDAKLRDAMRLELVKLQQTIGITFIMVTHDQSEALAVADRVAVIDKGKLRQLASPEILYQQPSDAFVADFIGKINLFTNVSTSANAGSIVSFQTREIGVIPIPTSRMTNPNADPGDYRIAVRPEKIKIAFEGKSDHEVAVHGRLGDVAFQGESSVVEILLDNGSSITAFVTNDDAAGAAAASDGAEVWCGWDLEDMLVLPKGM